MGDIPTFDETHGAMLVGVLIASFLQGILTVQLYHYFVNFARDPRFNKCLVIFVWALDFVHLIFVTHATYHYLISNWGNEEALMFSTVLLNLHVPLIGLTALVCQIYFLRRIWLVTSRNMYIAGSIGLLCVITLGIEMWIAVKILRNLAVTELSNGPIETGAMFILTAICDVAIAGVLCLFLDKNKGEFKRTNNVITKLIRFSVTTSLCTALLAVACAIAYFIKPNTFIFIAMHFSLGRMYTNALLATLNARRSLQPLVDPMMMSSDTSRTPHTRSNHRQPFSDPEMDGSQKHPGILVTTMQTQKTDTVELNVVRGKI